jgi:hypothetical protein
LNDLQSIAEALLNTVFRSSSTQNGKFKIKVVPALYFDKISEKNGRLFCNPVNKKVENLLIVTLNYKNIFIKP